MDTKNNLPGDASHYERDFYDWCQKQAARLRERARPGVNDGVDYENLAEEIESLGRADKNAIRSHIVNLLMHLLKWQFQPKRRGQSWRTSITNSRAEISYLMEDSPSLRHTLGATIDRAYPIAMRNAAVETKLRPEVFPADCNFTPEQLLDDDFFPDNLDGPASK